MVFKMRKQFSLLISGLIAVLLASVSLADPPAHAPAHGWRKKHDPAYVGYTGTSWERDYDISSGHCNREEIGAVLGGVVGGVVGSRVGSDGNRTVATIIGVAAGALIGSRIGRELDESDRGCFGHALEIGEPGRRVTWSNPNTGVSYSLLPGKGTKTANGGCRSFELLATRGGKKEKRNGTACQDAVGAWRIRD
jgi:surface antigen